MHKFITHYTETYVVDSSIKLETKTAFLDTAEVVVFRRMLNIFTRSRGESTLALFTRSSRKSHTRTHVTLYNTIHHRRRAGVCKRKTKARVVKLNNLTVIEMKNYDETLGFGDRSSRTPRESAIFSPIVWKSQ